MRLRALPSRAVIFIPGGSIISGVTMSIQYETAIALTFQLFNGSTCPYSQNWGHINHSGYKSYSAQILDWTDDAAARVPRGKCRNIKLRYPHQCRLRE
ncbi:hypothetical protein V1515DRAFT_605907 [Lipomyces mesembrius]